MHAPSFDSHGFPGSVCCSFQTASCRLSIDKREARRQPARLDYSMYPSYPCFKRCNDLAVQFAVPERHVVRHILDCTEGEENLRCKAAANVLIAQVKSVGGLMSRHRIQVESIGYNEMGVTLFLPPPPCPAPKSQLFSTRKRRPFTPTLASIEEEEEQRGQLANGESRVDKVPEWITMYEYLPSDKRKAVHIMPNVKAASLKLFL